MNPDSGAPDSGEPDHADPGGADQGSGAECPAGFAATGLLWVATLLLPRGVSRNRYRREFAAELYGRPRTQQLAYALAVCVHMWSLRTVLVHGSDIADLPLRCRTNLHHHWQKHVNDEGVRFQTCSRCGREKESPLANSLFSPMRVGGLNH